MMNLILHSLQPSRGAVNFILAQLYGSGSLSVKALVYIANESMPIGSPGVPSLTEVFSITTESRKVSQSQLLWGVKDE